MTQKTTLYVHGMHCSACVMLTQDALQEDSRVNSAVSSLATCTVELEGDFDGMTADDIAQELTPLISEHGYTLSTQRPKKNVNWNEFTYALPIAFGFLLLFILLQKMGIVNLVTAGNVTYGTAFVVGIIASLSTCMAVVGGLVLSMSATYAKHGDTTRPHILFHIGRFVSFFILGGVIGAIGSVFQLNAFGIFIVGLIVGIVMLLLGINLLDVFGATKKLQPSMPQWLSKRAMALSTLNLSVTPVLIGIATFFLPCGFTQAMQIATLSTGSFLEGGLTMLAFAGGTFPVLAILSFSSYRIQNNKHSGIFFKSAGLIVILFALFNILNSFVAIGLLPPLFNL